MRAALLGLVVVMISVVGVLTLAALAGIGLLVIIEPDDDRYSPTDDFVWAQTHSAEPPDIDMPSTAPQRRSWWRP